MFTHPYLARERQRDMLAQADQQRLARQLRDLARASQGAARAQRRLTRPVRRGDPAALPS
jgi:hypothetical protein